MNVLSRISRRAFQTVRHWFTDGVFRRIFKNAALMLTGRATNGLLGLATLSLSARGLGLELFGVFVLLQTYVQVITALATFQSWQAVIRYGAISLEENDTPGFQALLKFTTGLDFAGVLLGTLIGFAAAPLIGPYLGWSEQVIGYAQPFSLLILFTMTATPTGLLRLYDRFDLLAAQAVVTPLFRLVGVAVAVFLDAPLWGYLVAWFVASVIGGAVLIYLGWREARRHGRLMGLDLSFRGTTAAHGGIWRFSIFSNLHASLQIVTGQMSTLLVGVLAGPAAAGIFKIGRDVATAISKPAELLNQSIYPEFARLGSRGDWQDFKRLIVRGGVVAGAGAVALLILAIFAGRFFIGVFFGPDFAEAYLPLVLLVATAGMTICGFPMDPALYAMGRPSIPLRIDTVVILGLYLPSLVILTRVYGPTGAAAASLITAAVSVVAMTLLTAGQLRRRITATSA
jgi:O-antigen/teichoic acid export membrane protein